MSITAHCLIRNEENFIWYALQSVLPYVDKILVWDTGSTDKTVEIIKSINSSKIEFEERGQVNEAGHTALRNEMIAKTTTDWFMILDGDEVWPEGQIKEVLQEIALLPPQKNCILSKFIFCVGDIYHHSSWGKYRTPWGKKGHFTLRFFRKIKDIHWQGSYDNDTLYYENEEKVYTLDNCCLSEHYFFHCGVLPRSTKDSEVVLGIRRPVNTYALGLLGHGTPLSLQVELPEVFSLKTPKIVYPPPRLAIDTSIKNLASYIKKRL